MTDSKTKSTLQKAEERLSSLASTLTHSASSTASSLTSSAAKTASTIAGSAGSTHVFPAFDDLPHIPGQPQGCMWGYWDNGPIKDEIGTLNLLAPMVVKQASAEIKTGEHVQLDWGLENVEFPSFGRRVFENKVIGKLETEEAGEDGDGKRKVVGGACVFDNELHFNTQSGSQWDGHKHFGHQASGMFYNGVSYDEAEATPRNGMHNWCARGGIVSRAILCDWLRWHEATQPNPPPSPITRAEIPISEIIATLAYQHTVPRPGDILIIRTGFVRWHNFATSEVRAAMQAEGAKAGSPQFLGLKADEETVRWLYDRHFAAVAGDAVTLEAWPPVTSKRRGTSEASASVLGAAQGDSEEKTWCLHEWLLTQWGTPIGEMWDLETLSKVCEKEGRWSFFLTSAPLNVRGGVGSPPGAIAVF